MATYLLTWNPLKWDWENLDTLSEAVSEGQMVLRQWSCGNSKRICKGDRLFIISLGKSLEVKKGIFASGFAQRDSYEDFHWDQQQSKRGDKSQFTDILFDTLLNPVKDIGIPRALLDNPPFTSVRWGSQRSGINISDDVARQLEKIWEPITKSADKSQNRTTVAFEDQIYFEGVVHQLTLTRYERNKQARLACLQHYGTACVICDFDFGEKYGELGAGFIHVHHITPLSEINAKYSVDPINDLRPVCPNCHAMIHRRTPPFKIDEIKSMLSKKLG